MSERVPRVIAVTGSASGIGAATAARLEQDGHRVIRVDWKGGDVVADLGTPAGRTAAADGIRRAAGGALDGLVSGAGLGPYDDAAAVVRVNYFGAVAVLDALLDVLARGREPAAVAISSIGAVFEAMHLPGFAAACLAGDEAGALAAIAGRDGNTAYTNAKHALALGVRRRAPAWGAAGVRLNGVLPGKVATPMLAAIHRHEALGPAVGALPVPLAREAPPEELAAAIAFLLGPDARYVHGALLKVDGGADAVVRPDAL
jgi:NAD(P)-dependent dehydrogenase (short-subunit alcohol dehydrogenase family)